MQYVKRQFDFQISRQTLTAPFWKQITESIAIFNSAKVNYQPFVEQGEKNGRPTVLRGCHTSLASRQVN